MFGKQAKAFLSVFFATERLYTDRPVIRTGQPIRKQLRDAAHSSAGAPPASGPGSTIVVLGGSQGSAYLNEAVPNAVAALDLSINVIHSSGPTNFAATSARVKGLNLENYRVEPYLDADAMVDAYSQADLVVCRSGSTLAELAMFGIPSVLVPLPSSADRHQFHNAKEFEDMKAATMAEQEPAPFANTARAILGWLEDSKARAEAATRLKDWDVPDATERILAHIEAAAM
jgi:UDP-N-acetylglucosamine--N-acetylmuramyl-(pentapeptide) pyrophosphoryl-undecaprenol N-acetylglucosamine transferase